MLSICLLSLSLAEHVFFDSAGRIKRARGPSAKVVHERFVPVHSGLLLVRAEEDGVFEPQFLTETQAQPWLADDGCINAWLGECAEGALAPEPGPWKWYVLVDPDGTHFFTDDFGEFERAKAEAIANGVF